MNIIITGRKLELTAALRDTITKKLNKLSKFFDDDTECNATMTVAKGERHILEVTIYSKGIIYRAEEESRDMYAAVDRIVDVIERQIRKNKTRLEKNLRENIDFAQIDDVWEETEEEKEFNVVKTKRYGIKPMSVDEAILQMNLLGHNFFVFKNGQTDESNIVYKRKDGTYGLIEID